MERQRNLVYTGAKNNKREASAGKKSTLSIAFIAASHIKEGDRR